MSTAIQSTVPPGRYPFTSEVDGSTHESQLSHARVDPPWTQRIPRDCEPHREPDRVQYLNGLAIDVRKSGCCSRVVQSSDHNDATRSYPERRSMKPLF